MRHHDHDGEPYVVIEKHSGDAGSLLLGVLIGAGVALLFAPTTGEEARRAISRRARAASDAVKDVAQDMTGQVADTFDSARARVEEQLETARSAIEAKRSQVSRAMEAGREAAQQARGDLERRLAQSKAAYHAGADVARTGGARRRMAVPFDDETR